MLFSLLIYPLKRQENFPITLPKLRMIGLWHGSPYIELAENSWTQSSVDGQIRYAVGSVTLSGHKVRPMLGYEI